MAKLYLGRKVDPKTFRVTEEPLLLDSDELVTHAVILGMTGSGKTGTAIVLLEEALLNGIPVLVIDPKGDATNIALRVKQYTEEEILPWVPVAEAKRVGLSPEDYARKIADNWLEGLREWGVDPSLAEKLAEIPFDIYTPGSRAGIPVSVLGDLNKPEGLTWEDNDEVLRERVDALSSAILHLAGLDASPLSPPHVYLSRILLWAWRNDIELDFNSLITFVLHPPFSEVGALHVDTFIPGKERKKLAVALNSVIASPFFKYWIEGVPLDTEQMLWGRDGRPRAAIFYLAHLDDRWRMFAVTLILEAVYTWMFRAGSAPGLRCLIYFDEVFGYLPPYPLNPPSKRPIMLLLKQGRAFGVGIVLSTQNPVDVDYKALSNAGIWIIGRLQTERDRERVLQGLEMAAVEAGKALPLREARRLLASLERRVFLVHNVYRGEPQLLKTRWALTILRGPLTLEEIPLLIRERPSIEYERKDVTVEVPLVPVPPEIKTVEQFFLPVAVNVEGLKAYFPVYVVSLNIDIRRAKPPFEYRETMVYFVSPIGEGGSVNVQREALGLTPSDITPTSLRTSREPGIKFKALPKVCLTKGFVRKVKASAKRAVLDRFAVKVYYVPGTKVASKPGESLENFVKRVEPLLKKLWENRAKRLLAPYRRRVDGILSKLKALEVEIGELEAELSKLRVKLLVMSGDKKLRRRKESIERRLKKLRVQKKILKEEYEKAFLELEEVERSLPPPNSFVHSVLVKPRRSEVEVEDVRLLWVPVLLDEDTLLPRLNLYTGRSIS